MKYNNHVRCQHCDWELFPHTPTKDEDIEWHTCRVFTCSNYDCRFNKPQWYVSKELHISKSVWYKPWTWFKWEVVKEVL